MEKAKKYFSKSGLGRFTREYSIVLVTLVVLLGATVAVTLKYGTPLKFLDGQNFINILRANSIMGIIAFGMAFVIISGNIDLSVGSQMALVGILMFKIINALDGAAVNVLGIAISFGSMASITIGILAAVVFSCMLSMGCGLLVTKGRVPSFIVTLGLSYLYRSLSISWLSSGGIKVKDKAFQLISNQTLGGIPLPIIYFFIVFVIYLYISRYTVLGRRIYAAGSNATATKLSGINTDRVKILAFLLLGLTVAIAAMVEGSRMNSMNSTNSGNGYDLNTIAMAVVGGIAMEGGKGNFVNCLFGIIILGVVNNILTLMGMDVYLVNAVKGVLIIFAVLLQHKSRR
ncbi:MAG: ABC transporter permease [Clostridia bacterium]|nr:ABC transporter permease [Clostridia bacterium]